MLSDFIKSFLESLKVDGYQDIIDSDLCKGIIFAASNMSDEVLASWYRDTIAACVWVNGSVDAMSDCDFDEVEDGDHVRFFYYALVDILAAICLVRHIVLVPRLDS